jgi:hypothetical protein
VVDLGELTSQEFDKLLVLDGGHGPIYLRSRPCASVPSCGQANPHAVSCSPVPRSPVGTPRTARAVPSEAWTFGAELGSDS